MSYKTTKKNRVGNKMNLLDGQSMTEEQAEYIKARFKSLPTWNGMKTHHPKFVEAVEMLPNEGGFQNVNTILHSVFQDARKEAESLLPSALNQFERGTKR